MLLAQNLAEQLKWSKFVNTCRLACKNISCDLYNEHLNRAVKDAVEKLGANKSKKAIVRAAKAISVVTNALESFDNAIGTPSSSGKHSVKTINKRYSNHS